MEGEGGGCRMEAGMEKVGLGEEGESSESEVGWAGSRKGEGGRVGEEMVGRKGEEMLEMGGDGA